jgi:lysyl-tRNA synthetase class 2
LSDAAYPPFRGERATIAKALAGAGGQVAGRIGERGGETTLRDESAAIAVTPDKHVNHGDWVTGHLERVQEGTHRLTSIVVLAPSRTTSPDPDLCAKLPHLRARAEIVQAARTFFHQNGFLEVETPSRVRCPGLEPHLRAFPAGHDTWLITSPELHLKRMLAAGAERIVEFARAFRDDERGAWHRAEFLLVEWYRAFEGLEAIEADCEALVETCARAAGRDVALPFERTTVREALASRTGLDIAVLSARDDLERAIATRGHTTSPEDSWDDLFFRAWIAEVEPKLGTDRPVFVHDYPASQAALARTRREPWGEVAERFELYFNGVEIANAFHELNDPDEQRRRHEADRAARREAGAPVYPLDESFLDALESGMPPASGIAFGLERLVALLLGQDALDAISAF